MPQTLLHQNAHLLMDRVGEHQSARFCFQRFVLPSNCIHLQITLSINSKQPVQLPLCLFDAHGQMRMMKAGHTVTQETLLYEIGEDSASQGGIAGPLPAGNWSLVLYKRRMREDADVSLEISCEIGTPHVQEIKPVTFSQRCLKTGLQWYQGELHTHSSESTGRTPVADVVRAARECGLDFLALTDHFTASHWSLLEEESHDCPPLLLQSVEVSGDRGHANLHGLNQWMNPLVDDNEELSRFLNLSIRPSMNQLADDTHKQGGLMCINHPLSGEVGWRYPEFDLSKADLIEVYCASELDPTLAYPSFYDMLLSKGLHLTAVGSSDSHHPTQPGPWKLGQVRTYIYAEALSQAALLAGLKAGHAYVSINQCEMNMTAQCGDHQAMMGDTLPLSSNHPAVITVSLLRHPRGNLYLYRNGMLWETRFLPDDTPVTLHFTLPEDAFDPHLYVRMEFYEIEGELPYYGYSWRNWKTLRLLSNPIYFDKGDHA